MKTILRTLVASLGVGLALAVMALGQTGSQINLGGNQVTGIVPAPKGGTGTTPGSSLPATPCTNGKTFVKTNASPSASAIYACIGTAWVLQSGGGSVTNLATGCGTSGGPITATGTIKAILTPKSDATAAYLSLDADCGKRIRRSFATAMSDTLPQANGSTFINGWFVEFENDGPGSQTITPTVSTFQGAVTSILLYSGQHVRIVSDGSNYSATGQFVLCPGCAGSVDMGAGTPHTATGVGFQAPAVITTPNMMTLPAGLGAASSFLQTNGANPQVLSWQPVVIKVPLIGYSNTSGVDPADSQTYFWDPLAFNNTTACASNSNRYALVSPITGTITDLFSTASIYGTLGTSENVTFTLLKNCVATALTMTQQWTSALPTIVSDSAHTASVTKGDLLQLRIVTPAWATNPTTVTVGPWGVSILE